MFAATTILANEAVELCERVHDLLFDADDWREGLTHETVESALALAGEAQEKATAAENKAKEAWPPNGASETVWQAARNYGGEHAQGAASDAMGRAQTALQHARDAERWITERAFAALVGDQGEYRVLEQGAGVSDAKNAFRQHEKNYRKNPDDAHHIDQADDGSRPGENGTRRDQNAELRDDDERRARYVINDSEIEPFTDSEMALFIHMEVEQEDSETDMEEGRALDGQLDQDDDDDDAGVDGEYIDPRDVAVSTVRVDKEEEPEQADKRGGGDVDGDYNGEDSSNRMRLLKLANLRYRQTRCWLERMNGEGAPHELGTWLTNDEMRDIEMRVRAACVQWAREGGGHEPVGRTNPKGSPLIWAILMMLQVLAERHTPPRVLVHEREYTDGTETFRASTFYTMQGLWMYLERFGSQPCTDREPQNGANTGVRGNNARTQKMYVDSYRKSYLRYDSLGDDDARKMKAWFLHHLLRRAVAAPAVAAAAAAAEERKRAATRAAETVWKSERGGLAMDALRPLLGRNPKPLPAPASTLQIAPLPPVAPPRPATRFLDGDPYRYGSGRPPTPAPAGPSKKKLKADTAPAEEEEKAARAKAKAGALENARKEKGRAALVKAKAKAAEQAKKARGRAKAKADALENAKAEEERAALVKAKAKAAEQAKKARGRATRLDEAAKRAEAAAEETRGIATSVKPHFKREAKLEAEQQKDKAIAARQAADAAAADAAAAEAALRALEEGQ